MPSQQCQSTEAIVIVVALTLTRMWADAHREASQPNIGGALCESSVIPFLISHRKVWLTPTVPVPCSNAANIGERKTLTQSEFCTGQNSVTGQEPPKNVNLYMYSVPAQETAKHRAKFGWLLVSDVATVTKQDAEPVEICLGAPKLMNWSQPLVGWSSPWGHVEETWGHVEEILLFNKFFPIFNTCLSCEDTARQSCAMVHRWQFLRHFCVLYLQRAACSTFQTGVLNSH